ncbi:YfbK domain-containing protein [Aquimarina sp. 2201CG5-10]|uniref:YfbK domain-containing protein n=1 Tax=Aquimarina callyspongiae TaxID=3098150 RepID=UPI002AB515AE|nr:von Willebrand factor type A domain-containing protein [Aquimarina sp. 2201CG5-10]MDY8136202.1 von Willebrand factor type A domain-containing protein [Aquimarina sp. 2201CG5-10]
MRQLNYLLILLFITGISYAQQIKISGTVSDESNISLPGVNVVIKGSTIGTQTNFDGKYTITANVNDILQFGFIGYELQEVKVTSESKVIDVQMVPSLSLLEEVVVTTKAVKRTRKSLGYTVSKVGNQSISRRKSNRRKKRIKTNLNGRVSGVAISQNSDSKSVMIRGLSSISNNKQPLYIVDGVPIEKKDIEAIRVLNPDKISKVKVYKRAQASSIFGSKAKHGCVVITTHAGNYRVNNESYKEIIENDFKRVHTTPLSTFSIDVDKASYSNIRRMINAGDKIPADAVKIEEMVNYFSYNYPQPTDVHPFAIHTEYSASPWNKGTQLVKIGLKGKEVPKNEIPASNLVFLIDVSGSMGSSNKLPLLKNAFKLLVNQLREKDKVSIVVYAGAAGMVLKPTSGAHKNKIIESLQNLEAGGSTAGGEGIKLAYKIAKENFIKNGNNRVILATDGDFNVGMSSDKDMKDLILEKRQSGVFLTCLGFGMGNYKDSKLETLADKGNGNHAYIDTMQEAQLVLGKEFGGTLYTIAKDVKIQVEFNPGKIQAYRLIGYENRLLADEDFIDDTKDAGELGSGHTVTALYEVIPVGVKSEYVKNVANLKYTEAKTNTAYGDELLTVKFRYKKPQKNRSVEMTHVLNIKENPTVSEDFKFAASVAWFGMLLRKSKYVKNQNIEDITTLASSNKGKDEQGYRSEFVRLINSYQGL